MWCYLIIFVIFPFFHHVANTPKKFFESPEELTKYLNGTDMELSEIIDNLREARRLLEAGTFDASNLRVNKKHPLYKDFHQLVDDDSWEVSLKRFDVYRRTRSSENDYERVLERDSWERRDLQRLEAPRGEESSESTGDMFPDFG